MNFAVGSDKISEAARKAIATCGGVINPTNQAGISMIRLPEEYEMEGPGDHRYITISEQHTLHFIRAWHTKDCALDL